MNNHEHDEDVTSFIARYTSAQQEIYRYILMVLPNPTDAKDVLQETAVALWRKRDEYDPSRPFLPWACRFARNHVLNHCRRVRRSAVLLEPAALEAIMIDTPYPDSRQEARMALLRGCLSKLSDRDRQLIADRYERKATLQQVAELNNNNVQSLYKRLQRLRKRLYECVNRQMEQAHG